jgi:lysophospholipase L1-like esterase
LNKGKRRLLILGDSISLGVSEVRGSEVVQTVSPSYVDLLRDQLHAWNIHVDADLHRTTSAAPERIDNWLASALPPDACLIMLGGNDADLDWKRFVLSEGRIIRNRVAVARYRENLRSIVHTLLDAGVIPVLTDMPNHHFEIRGPYVSRLAGKDVVDMLRRNGGQEESNRHWALYRAAVASVAADTGAALVRYGEALAALPPEKVLSHDGAHPGTAGHRVIAQCLLPVLSQLARPMPSRLRA